MASKQKSRACPHCKSNDTERMGEFAICRRCAEPFHHSTSDVVETGISGNDALGGTENG